MEVEIEGKVKGINIGEDNATVKIQIPTGVIKDTEIMSIVGDECKICIDNNNLHPDQETLDKEE